MKDFTFKLVAIILSIALHSLLFANLEEKNITEKESKKRDSTPIKISLIQPTPKPIQKKEIPQKKVVQKTPQFKPKVKPKKPLKPKPKKIIKKEIIKKPTPTKKVITTKPAPIKKEKNYNGEKNLFLIDLKKRIEENKEYPRSARRRGIEGEVNISFIINKNGELQDLKLIGNRVLKKASTKAIEGTFPVEKKEFFPMDIKLKLRFLLLDS